MPSPFHGFLPSSNHRGLIDLMGEDATNQRGAWGVQPGREDHITQRKSWSCCRELDEGDTYWGHLKHRCQAGAQPPVLQKLCPEGRHDFLES